MSAVCSPPPISTGPNPNKRPHKASARRQAVQIQALLAKYAIEASDGKTCAFIARSWCDVNEELRKLAMRPVPRPIDTTKLQPRRRRASQSVEPIEPA